MKSSGYWKTAALGFSVAAMLLVQSGCGGGGGGTVVHGNVAMDGKPVTSGGIFFMKAGERPIGGPISAAGAYEYVLPAGEYQVRIDAPAPIPANHKDGDPVPQLPRLVPEKFAGFSSSGLTATVTGDSSQQLDFALP